MTQINPKIIRQIFSLLLIILLGGLIFQAILPYFSGILGAITIYVLLRAPMAKLIDKGWPPNLAAITLLIGSFICILLPVSGIVLMLGNKVESAIKNSEKVISAVKSQLTTLENKFGYDFTSQIDASGVSTWLSKNLQGFAGGTFNIFIAIAIMYFLLFYMLTNRRQLRESLFDYIPISKENLKIIGGEVRAMVRSNALGIPLVALAQGIIALIGFLIFGVQAPFFWAVIVTIGSMVPFIGSLLGIVPVFILSLSEGNTFEAWGILLYGVIVVGATDNIFRLYVLKKLDNVHPLITLIGVIVGVPIFGFIGLIFGPILISLFLITVRMYKKEYAQGNPR
ncbi:MULTISPECIES: AI-2E family transporter [unclassified Arenibacter]|uniref:AI-2E family transporter n=1 Tax=unclassified Arenibacter TaxID=2615047 RepID=UPI000E3528DE|nr:MULTISPECIES: AI-2E family transporter [unclassified Arenibacter]MCM4164595.1 AI-2E family transporter [Arenibacter sp. A80]RFT55677.1 AI-2E family transporter [Arenibacter sp. P308M17]